MISERSSQHSSHSSNDATPAIIAVDIGNSAIKLAWVPRESTLANPSSGYSPESVALNFKSFGVLHDQWRTDLISFRQGGGTMPALQPSAIRWVIASVNGPVLQQLFQLLKANFPGDEPYEITRHDIPLETNLRNPDQVGIDRLLGSWEAMIGSGQTSVISIDAGSAVTVDLIHKNRFAGGAILPGIRLQFAALRQGTDRLPAIVGDAGSDVERPGLDTTAAMRAGVLLGIAGAIERLVNEYSQHCGFRPPVVFTGGDCARLAPLLSFAVHQNPSLVLSAILRIARGIQVE